jgi:hypothetical protein
VSASQAAADELALASWNEWQQDQREAQLADDAALARVESSACGR